MSYIKRLDLAFEKSSVLPVTNNTKYVFFSDCHRGVGNNNDNFLKNENCYLAALHYYYQNGVYYIEVGDGDELWENKSLNQIMEIHEKIFSMLSCFQKSKRSYLLYGNHDMVKKGNEDILEGIIFHSQNPPLDLYVTHGHQADFLNSVLWKLARFLVRHLWAPLEYFGVLDPTSAAKNNKKRNQIEKRLINYAKNKDCLLLCGHTHRPTLGNAASPYFNCGSCVHPKGITCIELDGFHLNLVKWYASVDPCKHFGDIYNVNPAYPLYIKREVLEETSLLPNNFICR